MLEIKNLHVKIESKEILHGINLTIPDGEVHALLGSNGSGKTTLMMTIMGYPEYEVTKGEIIINGKDILDLDITERAKLGIGISQQRPPTIKGVKLRQILDFFIESNSKRKEYIDIMVEKFNMDKFLDRDINSDLSGGEIKRSELFQVMASLPKFLMLDEPDSGIDPEQLAIIGGVINECLRIKDHRGPTIKRNTSLIITHLGNILDYVHVDCAHLLLEGSIRCNGNAMIMLNQIKKAGYEYCIRCQKLTQDNFEKEELKC